MTLSEQTDIEIARLMDEARLANYAHDQALETYQAATAVWKQAERDYLAAKRYAGEANAAVIKVLGG